MVIGLDCGTIGGWVRYRKNITTDTSYTECEADVETTKHILRNCCLANEGYMLEVRHILREGNHFADHLANLAQNGTDGLVHLHNPLPLFLADVLRHGRTRF
ncbi:hypothetical protein Goarm_019996 [Gossypium armourianum]|uniref:Uncharacterized protein n=1 Tax=Gossypium armourianum TaxID=34283 RepID=A0A7J9INR4_9ROSI|nr:hypothetical protein [Gossypium armourianum]